MFQEVVLVHRKTQAAEFPDWLNRDPWISWNTCLRKIRFGLKGWMPEDLKSELHAEHQVFVGEEAYKFCLEVVCGLHSPMLGETEVMGQFKEACKNIVQDKTPAPIQKFLSHVWADAKNIRSEFLVSIGSHNYGSLLRKHVKDFDHVVLVGGGQLAQEMAPWLKEKVSVQIVTRSPEKPHTWTRFLNNVYVSKLDFSRPFVTEEPTAFVLAAPVRSRDVESWLSHQSQGKLVDLRGESHGDPLKTALEHVTLKDFFESIEENKNKISEQVRLAKESIIKLSIERSHSIQLRPFGWDDLCA